MRIRVRSILWRKWNKATFDSLLGISPGQYDIRLNKPEGLEHFFDGLDRSNPTDLGGFDIRVPLRPFDGQDPVPEWELVVHYMGPNSGRRDWIISSQRPESAYPLWRPGRGIPTEFDENLEEYLLLVRDADDGWHARWVHAEAVKQLAPELVAAMRSTDVGWRAV